jgi:anti-anti-sigma factor
MSTPLSVHSEHGADGGLVLRAVGEVDASNVADFAKALQDALNGNGVLTVDLSAVDYLDSAGINALVPHAESLHIIANPILMRVLRVSGLEDLATISAAPPSPS